MITNEHGARDAQRRRRARSRAAGLQPVTLGLALAFAQIAAPAAWASDRHSAVTPAERSRVVQICETVMGLSPHEPNSNVWGAAANPGLFGGENHYQGCIVSLSDTLARIAATRTALAADAGCRATGLADDSPALARCVLSNTESGVRVSSITNPGSEVVSEPSVGAYYKASNPEKARRMRRACAELGLSPVGGGFDACVRDLDETFFSIDNPEY